MKRIFSLFCAGVFFVTFLVGCSKNETNETVLRTFANWPLPPVFNGNPYTPGGDANAHVGFVYGKLAIYNHF